MTFSENVLKGCLVSGMLLIMMITKFSDILLKCGVSKEYPHR